jgi:hypothetical protein
MAVQTSLAGIMVFTSAESSRPSKRNILSLMQSLFKTKKAHQFHDIKELPIKPPLDLLTLKPRDSEPDQDFGGRPALQVGADRAAVPPHAKLRAALRRELRGGPRRRIAAPAGSEILTRAREYRLSFHRHCRKLERPEPSPARRARAIAAARPLPLAAVFKPVLFSAATSLSGHR